MRKLPLPKSSVSLVLDTCNAAIEYGLAARFKLSRDTLCSLESGYIGAALSAELSAFASCVSCSDISVSAPELLQLYAGRMVPRGSSGRRIYLEIRDGLDGSCALCDVRESTGLDHYLPKEPFPQFAFTPVNLLPACSVCNSFKSQYVAKCRTQELVHPYFDDFTASRWLTATLEMRHPLPPALRFEVAEIRGDAVSTQRLRNHFSKFGLALLYGKYSASEFAELRGLLTRQFEIGDSRGVSNYLRNREAAAAAHRSQNYWKAVSYRAWAECAWFVSGGYATPAVQEVRNV